MIKINKKRLTKNEFKQDHKDIISTESIYTQQDASKDKQGRWTKEEHRKFLEAIDLYGRDWKKLKEHIGTRSCV